MSVKVFPDDGYNSFISEADADEYFSNRLNSDKWATSDKEAALITAFRSFQELHIVADLTDSDTLHALAAAQCEQALHELNYNLDELQASSVSLGGLVSVKLKNDGEKPPRFNPRALGMLRPYLRGKTMTRIR